MRQLRNIYIFILTGLALSSCKEDAPVVNDPISHIPSIEVRSISPQVVTAFEDSIVLELFYQDGNGDLGFSNPDSNSLFVVDTRIFTVEDFFVPMLAPEGSSVAIQGVLRVVLDRTILVDPDASEEQVQFQVFIRDRAGQYSDIVVTPFITVVP
ncbi:MAG: hypothetical protein ABR95_03375 [Sphingobacteriales bacterium BACL12 MAG-120813-bin55]|jgi:hypothetical protein|nr:MAG: hypothetical protein ABR94_00645 [Sphingobacteriales bacterium BACL12 MAG-120802-bin5]KRP08727.1 MAG: hypothetical protein ABR95_03375 [Sphingobacteriales bacterium BACL12 MAG-120813-bin55]